MSPEAVHRNYPGSWHATVDFLSTCGVTTVLGLPDDELGLLHALEHSDLRFVACRDQRSAVFMATGYALQSGRVGVCVVGKGPAATNALTGLLEASRSAAPVLVLASGTGADRRGAGAFQELDQLAVTSPLVKGAHRVEHPDRLVPALERAVMTASTGVTGPVYLELPDHLTNAEIVRTRPWARDPHVIAGYRPEGAECAGLDAVRASRCPIVLVGGGMRHRNGDRVVERFAERFGAAVFTTASGRGVVDEDHERFCGLSGLYARPATEGLWREADLIVAVGSRLEETATLGWQAWDVTAPVLQVNLDASELSCEFPGPRVVGDGAGVLSAWTAALPSGTDHRRSAPWTRAVVEARETLHVEVANGRRRPVREATVPVADVLAALDAALPGDRILVQENGLQDMWSYLYPYCSHGSRGGSIVPSEQTSLGFGAAAAGGVRLAAPDRPVVAFVGDGAFELVRPELATLAEHRLGVLYVVLRNGGYGWLQHQLDQHGLDESRFSFLDAEYRPRCEQRRGVQHVEATGETDLTAVVERAAAACARGDVVVVDVPVDPADVPPCVVEQEPVPSPQCSSAVGHEGAS